nr:unnamed protein product [Spirometra erinaceieuropaei]
MSLLLIMTNVSSTYLTQNFGRYELNTSRYSLCKTASAISPDRAPPKVITGWKAQRNEINYEWKRIYASQVLVYKKAKTRPLGR